MSEDLIEDLRFAALLAGPEARKLYWAAADEIERCHRRLEIDRMWKLGPDGGVPVTIPYAERASFPDGITCRDETISLLEGPRHD